MIDVQDPYAAYCFDDACTLWGSYVEHTINETGKNVKKASQREMMQKSVLKNLLRGPEREQQAAPKQFRDPAALFKKGGGK